MLNCNTLVINTENLEEPYINISGLELSINEDGSLTTKNKNGNKNHIGKNKHIDISINNTTQTILYNKENQIFFDNDISIVDEISFSIENKNYIKIKETGTYLIMYGVTLDMYKGRRSTPGCYIKSIIKEKEKNIDKSLSYTYISATKIGFGSINNSFIYNAVENEELGLFVKIKEGNGCFYTIPEATSFNIFRIN